MHSLLRLRSYSLGAGLLLGLLSACQSGAQDPAKGLEPATPQEASAPFEPHLPGNFQLLADRIEVEGPPALLDHLAVLQAEDRIQSRTEGRPEGLFSEHRVLAPGLDAVQAQLDAWSLSAFQSLEVLMGASDLPLSIKASGGVRLVGGLGGAETAEDLAAERLEFELDARGQLWRSVDGAPRALASAPGR